MLTITSAFKILQLMQREIQVLKSVYFFTEFIKHINDNFQKKRVIHDPSRSRILMFALRNAVFSLPF